MTPIVRNKTAQIGLMVVWIIVTLLFWYSVMADWSGNSKTSTPDEEIISSKPTKWWRLNSEWKSQKYTELEWEWRDNRAIELLTKYWHSWEAIRDTFIHTARVHRIYPEVLLCITYADTSIGKHLKTPYNWWNVWNNDRWDKVSYINIEQGINAMGWVLNWTYLKWKNVIWDLSPYEWGASPFYATSPENWEINVLNCLGMIHDKKIDWNFAFRR